MLQRVATYFCVSAQVEHMNQTGCWASVGHVGGVIGPQGWSVYGVVPFGLPGIGIQRIPGPHRRGVRERDGRQRNDHHGTGVRYDDHDHHQVSDRGGVVPVREVAVADRGEARRQRDPPPGSRRADDGVRSGLPR
jgi:hypothetical protein